MKSFLKKFQTPCPTCAECGMKKYLLLKIVFTFFVGIAITVLNFYTVRAYDPDHKLFGFHVAVPFMLVIQIVLVMFNKERLKMNPLKYYFTGIIPLYSFAIIYLGFFWLAFLKFNFTQYLYMFFLVMWIFIAKLWRQESLGYTIKQPEIKDICRLPIFIGAIAMMGMFITNMNTVQQLYPSVSWNPITRFFSLILFIFPLFLLPLSLLIPVLHKLFIEKVRGMVWRKKPFSYFIIINTILFLPSFLILFLYLNSYGFGISQYLYIVFILLWMLMANKIEPNI